MNPTKIALALTATTAVILGLELANRNNAYKELAKEHQKLVNWSSIAKRIIGEIVPTLPQDIRLVSEELAIDMEFYSIMKQEGL